MIDFDVIAYAMLGVSLSASAVQVGRWVLSANPRAIINAGRWSLAALIVLTPLVLLWLVMSGRTTLADTMLVSPSSTPRDDVFERNDNYYVYLKPFDVTDETVSKRMKFAGKPPVWITMPPH